MVSQQPFFPGELRLQTLFKNRYFIMSYDPGSLTTSMVDVLINKLEILIASMLDMDVSKRPSDVASVKQELQVISTLWSDINKSFWRPRLGYTQRVRQ